MKKFNLITSAAVLLYFALFASANIWAQEKQHDHGADSTKTKMHHHMDKKMMDGMHKDMMRKEKKMDKGMMDMHKHEMHDMDSTKSNIEMKHEEHQRDKMEKNEAQSSALKPWNTVCPVRGNEVDPEASRVEYNGKVYGFCCNGCDDKFMKDPEKYSKNLNEDGTIFLGEN